MFFSLFSSEAFATTLLLLFCIFDAVHTHVILPEPSVQNEVDHGIQEPSDTKSSKQGPVVLKIPNDKHDISHLDIHEIDKQQSKEAVESVGVLVQNKTIPTDIKNASSAVITNLNNETAKEEDWDGSGSATVAQAGDETGALYRLSLVLLGLCGLSIIYVSYRFYSTRRGFTRPTTVKKYGVLTQRTDIEMLPLPLDEDDDDDTVFDVGNHMTNR